MKPKEEQVLLTWEEIKAAIIWWQYDGHRKSRDLKQKLGFKNTKELNR